jgi:hypothetical protein
MSSIEDLKKKYDEWYFVPWEIGMLAKKWDSLSAEERKIAVPASQVYRDKIKSLTES